MCYRGHPLHPGLPGWCISTQSPTSLPALCPTPDISTPSTNANARVVRVTLPLHEVWNSVLCCLGSARCHRESGIGWTGHAHSRYQALVSAYSTRHDQAKRSALATTVTDHGFRSDWRGWRAWGGRREGRWWWNAWLCLVVWGMEFG